MTTLLRHRLTLLLALLLTAAVLAGCAAKPAAAPAPAPAPAAAPAAPAAPPPPAPVDKAALFKEAAVTFFNTLPTTSHQIGAQDLYAKIQAKDATLQLVDIRRPEDYAKGHVDGFINIPFAEIGRNIDKLAKDKQVVLSCYTGQTAGQAVGVLRMAGYNAITVKFGFQGITDAKLPLVTS